MVQVERKKLGFIPTLGIAVGTTIGGGVFALTGQGAATAGPLLPWAFGLAVLPILCTLAPVAVLAAALPTAGGNYKYPSRLLSPYLAIFAVWIFALGTFLGALPLYALSCVDYLRTLFPSLPHLPSAMLLLTFFYALNVFGIRLAASAEAVLVAVLISALVVYVVAGVPDVQSINLRASEDVTPGGFAAAAALLSFAYTGSNALIEMGHEIEKPARNIPLAIGSCLVLTLVLYVLVAVVTVGIVPAKLAADRDLAEIARMFLGRPALVFFVLGGAVTALCTTVNAYFMWGTKSLQVLCRDGFLPASLAEDHPRFGTPTRILSVIYFPSLAGVALPLTRATLSALAGLSGLVVLVPVLLAAGAVPRRCPTAFSRSRFRPRRLVLNSVIGVGVLVCVGAMIALLAGLVDAAALALLGGWVVLGGLYMWAVRSRLKISADPDWH